MRKGFLITSFALIVTGSIGLAQNPATDSPGLPDTNPNSCVNDFASCLAPGCEPCGPAGRFWASADYLLWWIKDGHVPPLVTGGTTASAGVLGAPGTVVLFGGGLDQNPYSGGQFDFGFWLDDCHKIGLETDFFFLGTNSTSFVAGGTGAAGGSTVVARPVVNANNGAEVSELVVSPGTLSGSIAVSAPSRLWGIQENVLCNLYCCGNCCSGLRIDLITGFCYLELDESVSIVENLAVKPSVPVIGGSTIGVFDQFSTHNDFYGGQVGAAPSGGGAGPFSMSPAKWPSAIPMRRSISTATRRSRRPAVQRRLQTGASWPCPPTSDTTSTTPSPWFPTSVSTSATK